MAGIILIVSQSDRETMRVVAIVLCVLFIVLLTVVSATMQLFFIHALYPVSLNLIHKSTVHSLRPATDRWGTKVPIGRS